MIVGSQLDGPRLRAIWPPHHKNERAPCGAPSFGLRLRGVCLVLGKRLASFGRNLRGNDPRGILGLGSPRVFVAEPGTQDLRADAEFIGQLLRGKGLGFGRHVSTPFRVACDVHTHTIRSPQTFRKGVHSNLQTLYKGVEPVGSELEGPTASLMACGFSVRGPDRGLKGRSRSPRRACASYTHAHRSATLAFRGEMFARGSARFRVDCPCRVFRVGVARVGAAQICTQRFRRNVERSSEFNSGHRFHVVTPLRVVVVVHDHMIHDAAANCVRDL